MSYVVTFGSLILLRRVDTRMAFDLKNGNSQSTNSSRPLPKKASTNPFFSPKNDKMKNGTHVYPYHDIITFAHECTIY